ncbi:MAG: IS1634 family transposase [Anaerolineales bacterium]
MFPRIVKVRKKNKSYQYLVISESVRRNGKSTTRNIANLGNVERIPANQIAQLIDGLIRLFELETHALSEGIEILESLEYGSIIFWQKLWNKMALSQIIAQAMTQQAPHVALEVEKYIQIMVVNRCVDPLSKLGATRWVERTCFKRMKGFVALALDVNHFYRSMDYLLRAKEQIERALFEQLRNLFSVEVKLTFYDITSSYFYTESCPIGANGYSRDSRPDLEQIVIGVVTSFEGYPIKHYVFEGNTKDETTVAQVVKELRSVYHIEQTTFVGDRGMITRLNVQRIESEGFDYIMGVKHRQEEICQMLLASEELLASGLVSHRDLQITERRVAIKAFLLWKTQALLAQQGIEPRDEALLGFTAKIQALSSEDEPQYPDFKPILQALVGPKNAKLAYRLFVLIKKYRGRYEQCPRYVICLNPERKQVAEKNRDRQLSSLAAALEKWAATEEPTPVASEQGLNKIFAGYKAKYRKFFDIQRDPDSDKAIGYRLNEQQLAQEKLRDGIFILQTNREDLPAGKVVDSYKDLKEVEALFDDLKHFVDLQPIRHWLTQRVRAHVFLCILALLLKRIFEINYLGGKATLQPLEEISKSKLVFYQVRFSEREDRTQIIPKVTTPNPLQKKYFNMVGIKNPLSLENIVW